MDPNELHPKTIEYIRRTGLEKRKRYGQFFTKRSIREKLLSKLPHDLFSKKGLNILDPSCGTGEFLLSCRELFRDPILEGWDIDPDVLKIAREIVPEAELRHVDALTFNTTKKYDIIVGNPPYFEFKPTKQIKREYQEILRGRTNIYSLFIYKSLKLLKNGGFLAFVVSPSMNNGAYFLKLREYISKNASIEYLEVLANSSLFDGANQSVMLLILKKEQKNSNDKYIFRRGRHIIFSQYANYLNDYFKDKTSLKELGYRVRTGRIVWNQHKDKLTDDKKAIPLIWSHNITSEGLKLNNNRRKKQYIYCKFFNKGPAIVVNRIIGQPGKAIIKAALVPKDMKFLAENHVNVIFPPKSGESPLDLSHVLKQLRSSKKLNVIRMIVGNTQISKTELEELFPFDKG